MLLATLWDGFDLLLFFICLSPLEKGQVTQKQKVHKINEINYLSLTNSYPKMTLSNLFGVLGFLNSIIL